MRFGDLDAVRLIAGNSGGRQWWPRSHRRQGKEPTATLTASSSDLDQFGGQGPSLPEVMARYDRTYALAHAATLILAVGAIYILLNI